MLSDAELVDAREAEAIGQLRVYVSNRTLVEFERRTLDQRVIRRKIEDRSEDRQEGLRTNRNKTGAILDEDLINGARRLWVIFDLSCASHDCAYGFVQTEDGRYRLQEIPVREGATSKVFRQCQIKRHEMKMGKLKSVSDSNAVYKLNRKSKNRPKTVFLEVKKSDRRRVRRRSRAEPGVD